VTKSRTDNFYQQSQSVTVPDPAPATPAGQFCLLERAVAGRPCGPVEAGAHAGQHLTRDPVTLADQRQQQMLRPDLVLPGFLLREMQDPVGSGGEAQRVVLRRLLGRADDVVHVADGRDGVDAVASSRALSASARPSRRCSVPM